MYLVKLQHRNSHDTNERNLAESLRVVAERDRAMIEGRAIFRKKGKHKRGAAGTLSVQTWNIGLSEPPPGL